MSMIGIRPCRHCGSLERIPSSGECRPCGFKKRDAWRSEHRNLVLTYHRRSYVKHKTETDAAHRSYHERVRNACFDAYGGKCVCCGETEYEFLTFEHVNGGGRQHRKTVPHTQRWLYKNGFPKDVGITLLCMNCNLAEGRRGGCPHKTMTPAYGFCVA